MTEKSLGDRMKIGALWTYIQSGFNAVLQFGTSIVLARLLEPEDFGLFFAVTAYTALVMLQIKFGLPQALLQAKELTQAQWNAAFWTMQTMALSFAGIVFVAAGWLEAVYETPDYANVMRWMTVIFFIVPYMSINETFLKRQMNFKAVSQIQLVAAILDAATTITAAWLGYGAYSLVMGGIVAAFYAFIRMAMLAPWKPNWSYSLDAIKSLFSFSWRIHLNTSISLLNERIDNMMIGKILGMAPLGMYQRGNAVARMAVDQVAYPLFQIMFSGFSRIQDDHERSVRMFEKTLCSITSAVFPLLLGLYFIGDAFIVNLYGEKWIPAIEPFKILIIGSFAIVMSLTMDSLLAAQNLIGRTIPIRLLELALTAAGIWYGSQWGLTGIAAAIAAKFYVTFFLLKFLMARSHMAITWDSFEVAIGPVVAACLVTVGIGHIVGQALLDHVLITSWTYFFIEGTAVALAYAISWYTLARMLKNNQAMQANLHIVHSILKRISPSS